MKRREVETSLEGIIATLHNTIEFVREQDARAPRREDPAAPARARRAAGRAAGRRGAPSPKRRRWPRPRERPAAPAVHAPHVSHTPHTPQAPEAPKVAHAAPAHAPSSTGHVASTPSGVMRSRTCRSAGDGRDSGSRHPARLAEPGGRSPRRRDSHPPRRPARGRRRQRGTHRRPFPAPRPAEAVHHHRERRTFPHQTAPDSTACRRPRSSRSSSA